MSASAPQWPQALARWLPPPLPRQVYGRDQVAHAIVRARVDGVGIPPGVDPISEGLWHQLRAVATGRCEPTPSAVRVVLAAIGVDVAAFLAYLDQVDAEPMRAILAAHWLAALHPPTGWSAQHVAALAAHTRGPVACLPCLRRTVAAQRDILRLAAADDAVHVTLRCGPWGPGLALAVEVRATAQGHQVRATVRDSVVLPRQLRLAVGLVSATGSTAEVVDDLAGFQRGVPVRIDGALATLSAVWAIWRHE